VRIVTRRNAQALGLRACNTRFGSANPMRGGLTGGQSAQKLSASMRCTNKSAMLDWSQKRREGCDFSARWSAPAWGYALHGTDKAGYAGVWATATADVASSTADAARARKRQKAERGHWRT